LIVFIVFEIYLCKDFGGIFSFVEDLARRMARRMERKSKERNFWAYFNFPN
jgi:GTP cyclohydrolase FolE2